MLSKKRSTMRGHILRGPPAPTREVACHTSVGPAQRGAAMSFSIQWDRAFIHVSSCGCFCGRTHRSTGSHWKGAVPWRELALRIQDWPSWGSRRCGGECWRQLNRVRVGSVNRCEMPMAGRAHLHPPAHRVDGQDQSCKRSWLVPEHRVQRGSGPTQDPYQAEQLQQAQGR